MEDKAQALREMLGDWKVETGNEDPKCCASLVGIFGD